MLGVVCGLKRYTQWPLSSGMGRRAIGKKVSEGLGLRLIQLPAYGQQLNPAERVFKEISRQIGGKVY